MRNGTAMELGGLLRSYNKINEFHFHSITTHKLDSTFAISSEYNDIKAAYVSVYLELVIPSLKSCGSNGKY